MTGGGTNKDIVKHSQDEYGCETCSRLGCRVG